MKTRNVCIACQSTKVALAFVSQGISYYRCHSCTHVFSLKVLASPYEAYEHREKYEKWKGYLHNVFRRRVQDIRQFKKKGKVLEVGCSLGFFMDELKRAKFAVEGLEPSMDAVRITSKRGLVVHKGYLEKNTLRSGTFDVVVLNHVMEHVPDPIVAVTSIHRLLNTGGLVCIENPNFHSLEARIFSKNWRYLLPTEHFSQFNPTSLSDLLARNGFEILSVKTYAGPYDFASFREELARCIRIRDWKRLVVYVMELPLATIETLTGTGSAVQCIAKKI